jgi:predicted HAD superfamily Cof-like phosphohydrolase
MVPTHGWVSEFQQACGDAPDVRWGLLREEAMEVKEALESGDRAKIAQELADLVYVAYGAALTHDIRLDEAIREVHRANMTKVGPDGKVKFGADGKVLKGPNYEVPDMRAALSAGPSIEDKRCPTCESIELLLTGDLL